MKTLLLMRHAKSSWKHPALDDHDRPLNKRGERDAPRMGRLLVKTGNVPDYVLSSTADRAQHTARLIREALPQRPLADLKSNLYMAGIGDYLGAIRAIEERYGCVLLVSHNPGTEELIEALTGEDVTMPTAAIAKVVLPVYGWEAVQPDGASRLEAVWRPKELEKETTKGET